jgi:hypothetical protein
MVALVASLPLGCASLGLGGTPEPSAGEITIVNDSDETICYVPIHPVSAPTQELDLLRLLREDPIEPHKSRRFRRGDIVLLNVEGLHRLTLLTCDGQASPIQRVDFAAGAVVTIDTF